MVLWGRVVGLLEAWGHSCETKAAQINPGLSCWAVLQKHILTHLILHHPIANSYLHLS